MSDTYDPFDDSPAAATAPTEAPAPEASPWEEPTVTNAPADVSTDQNYVTVILKGGTGYNAPSISIRGASVPDALGQIQGHEEDLKALVQASARFAKAFGTIMDGAKPAGGNAPANNGDRPAGKPAGADQAPNGEERYCKHGKMVFRSGVSQKTQKPYKMFACPERDRDAQCKAEFLN